ncbi:hypothetical protein [Flavobacterium sp.]|uniref:hypothetical protein n=1 Tax=Flavobacterium sp. TaxID=239 RepID=UPI000ED1629D|nr:hypothetical protein [Flavobacterium sp.]HCQ12029.1 hypothetical protein [Flavobacterium sp.]
MKKYFTILLVSVIIFSCETKEEDDSYKYLYGKLEESIIRDENTLNSIYYKYCYDIKNDSLERKRYDSLYKISVSIDEKLKNLDFSNHEKALKFRDSVAKVFGIPLKFLKDDDNKNLNDSVFKKMMRINILRLRETYHGIRIHRFTAMKVEDK